MEQYSASFKKRKSGKLKWVTGSFENEKVAREKLQQYINKYYPNEGYNLYGGPLLIKTN